MQHYIYIIAIAVLNVGLFIMLTSNNYVKKVIGLGVFQSSVLIFYIALGKAKNGVVPIDICPNSLSCDHVYSSPLPHVLMLTAIVVGFATMSVALALVYQIKREYGTISEDKIDQNK